MAQTMNYIVKTAQGETVIEMEAEIVPASKSKESEKLVGYINLPTELIILKEFEFKDGAKRMRGTFASHPNHLLFKTTCIETGETWNSNVYNTPNGVGISLEKITISVARIKVSTTKPVEIPF